MGVTPFDLYRIGDNAGAALDYIRVGTDVNIYVVNGIDWVIAENNGASVRSTMHRLGRPNSRWWRLAAQTQYSASLDLFNDHGNHWMFVPIRDMPLAEFLRALGVLNARFT
jgi:hypothetical protein